MAHSLLLIDAFTDKAFGGNPAGVVMLDGPADEDWMQSVAHELNQPETAFVAGAPDGFDLRWFTPTTEIELCGHATLAAAHALWETGRLDKGDAVRFHTKSGLLTCVGVGRHIAMDFPADPLEPADVPEEALAALGLEEAPGVWRGRIGYVIELDAPEDVRALEPDFRALASAEGEGFVVCAQGGPEGADFSSRYFCPAHGVDEDPVTGAAHCALGPLWGLRLGKTQVTGYQESQRGGFVSVKLEGERVTLVGQAVTVFKGELLA